MKPNGQKILLVLAVISLIFLVVKCSSDKTEDRSSYDSIYEESRETTDAYDRSDRVVPDKDGDSDSFPGYDRKADEVDDEYEGDDYDDYDADWYDDYDD